MSKTTTWANTKNLRGTSNANEGASHHVITVGKKESKRHLKDNNASSKQKEGYVLGGGSGKNEKSERRISIRNSNAQAETVERNRSRGKQDKTAATETGKSSSEKRNQSTSAKDQKTPPVKTKSSSKVPIEEFYRQKGVDYRSLRKICRMKVNGDLVGGKVDPSVHVDFYKPPDGYTMEDLPDSQGISSQNQEDPVSPAVIIAAQHKKDRGKILTLTPQTDSNEIIRRIQMGRRNKKVLENNPVSTPTVGNGNHDISDPFPDNSLNDSDLVMASQQVESEQLFESASERQKTFKDGLKRDINGNSKTQTPPTDAPFASTPLPNLIKTTGNIAVKETPKTARGVTRSRNRSNNTYNNNNSIFENSVVNDMELEQSKLSGESDDDTPRKLLKFDESPIKKVGNNLDRNDSNEDRVRIGEFDDDNEDELFSQVEIPGEIRESKQAGFESSVESEKSLSVTQLVETDSTGQGDSDCMEIDSYLDADALDAIAKLEAIHCSSSGSAGSTVNVPNNLCKKPVQTIVNVIPTKETPRSRARRQGLSRSTRRVVAH